MTTIDSIATTGCYIYAFIRAEDCERVRSLALHGVNDAELQTVSRGRLAVVLSEIHDKKIRPQRKFLSAHQKTVTEIAKNCCMLPVSFGLIAEDREQIGKILLINEATLEDQLTRVENKVEMTLQLNWTAENIVQYLVDRNQTLCDARAKLATGNASREDQIALGQAYEQFMNAERERHTETAISKLNPVCSEIQRSALTGENNIFRLSCLIDAKSEATFDAAVHELASHFDEDFAFQFSGPWPPYTFVQLALSME